MKLPEGSQTPMLEPPQGPVVGASHNFKVFRSPLIVEEPTDPHLDPISIYRMAFGLVFGGFRPIVYILLGSRY